MQIYFKKVSCCIYNEVSIYRKFMNKYAEATNYQVRLNATSRRYCEKSATSQKTFVLKL